MALWPGSLPTVGRSGLVTQVRHCGDPEDMWHVRLVVTDRIADIQSMAKHRAKGPVTEALAAGLTLGDSA